MNVATVWAKGTAKGTQKRLQRYGGAKSQKPTHDAAKVIETAAMMKTAAKVAKEQKRAAAKRCMRINRLHT